MRGDVIRRVKRWVLNCSADYIQKIMDDNTEMLLSASENPEAKKCSTFRATHKSSAQQHIQRFCSRQCSRKKNDVLRINPVLGKGFMCFVARVARFLKNIYITFLF